MSGDTDGDETAGVVREWSPLGTLVARLPWRAELTSVAAAPDVLALGTRAGRLYWYDRRRDLLQPLPDDVRSAAPVSRLHLATSVEHMLAAGSTDGRLTVYRLPRDCAGAATEHGPPPERYTLADLHKSEITALEWSKNGMRLFSGDKNGVVVMTEIDFYMHLCKSVEVVNEQHEVVQLSYHRDKLLVATQYRTILCCLQDGCWHVNQVGSTERARLCRAGAVFVHSYRSGSAASPTAYVACGDARVWQADDHGRVLRTLCFREGLRCPRAHAELFNPPAPDTAPAPPGEEPELTELHSFLERFLVSRSARGVLVLDPADEAVSCWAGPLRRVVALSVTRDELFVVEGPRLLLRLSPVPDPHGPPPPLPPHRTLRPPPAPVLAEECLETCQY